MATTLNTGQVTAGATPTKVVDADGARTAITLIHADATACYVGGATVTTGNGLLLPQNVAVRLTTTGVVYIVGNTAVVTYAEETTS